MCETEFEGELGTAGWNEDVILVEISRLEGRKGAGRQGDGGDEKRGDERKQRTEKGKDLETAGCDKGGWYKFRC